MEDRRKMKNSSRHLRRHSVYSLDQRTISCGGTPILHHFKGFSQQLPELKIQLVCKSSEDANERPEEPNSSESCTDDQGYFSLVTPDTSPCTATPEPELQVDSLATPCCLTPVTTQLQFSSCDDAPPTEKNGEPPAKTADLKLEFLDGTPEEALDIGDPVFESSICQSSRITLDAPTDHVSVERKGVPERDVRPENVRSRTSVKAEEELSSPAPRQPQTTKKPQANGKRHRPVHFNDEEWEEKKVNFLNMVCAHMSETPQTAAFQELNSLMSRVTDQTSGPGGDRWQHPSDFTRRNYLARVGQQKWMTLRRWQEVNNRAHKRFSDVPKVFSRSRPPRNGSSAKY